MAKQGNPKVSVIIPTYNRGWILAEAIDSVMTQDFKDYELIVVDDGSSDDTADVLAAYQDRIRVLKQNNRGVSAARNLGIRASMSPLLAFLDSDDLWLPRKLSRQVAFFDANPDALICQSEEIWVRNGRRVNPKKRHQKLSGMIFRPSLELCLVSPSAVMINKTLFESVGLFDESLPACEDYDLWLRTSCRYPIFLIKDPLIVKRGGHADQLSRSAGLDKYRIRSMVKIIESGRLSIRQKMEACAVLRQKCRIYAAGCAKRGRAAEADIYLRLAQKYG